jgi:HEAT repeat protein
MMRRALLVVSVALATAAFVQESPPTSAADLKAAIGKVSSFDYPTRMEAARTIRRAAVATVVPLLAEAARSHGDEYVRYRALTLLAGFGPAVANDVMSDVLGDRNDRLRAVAYAWYEHHADAAILPRLIDALRTERSEFVRPALTRAIAAYASDERARAVVAPLVLRGDDFFRGAVIDALGQYGGAFALKDIVTVAQSDGPLQDDAITAIGRLGDASMVPTLGVLQKTAPENVQPTIAAAVCLLGVSCDETRQYLRKTLDFASRNADHQPLLRGAVHALGMLALRGDAEAFATLLDTGVAATADATRAPLALEVGSIALRRTAFLVTTLEARTDLDAVVELLRDAFDMLSEDFEKEMFYVEVRKTYWSSADGSAAKRVAEALIQRLEF